jgi:amino acid transporter
VTVAPEPAAEHHPADADERQDLNRVLGFWSIVGAGVGLVVATTTLVSDLNGWAIAGPAFLVSLLLGFLINLAVGLSFSELSTAFPRAGQIYEYSRDAVKRGRDYIATGVGTTYFAAMIFVFMAEISAGGNAMSEVTGGTPLWMWIVLITVLAVVPNVVGIQLTAWVEITIVAVMLAIRYLFGLVGFFDLSQSGDYDWGIWSDLAPFGAGAIVAALALAFWSFVGIEFVTPLVEETRRPERNMPRGIVVGLLIILATSLVMGLGIIGAVEPGDWTTLQGNAPQIPVGQAMLGAAGGYLMALASFLATLASINVGLAAIPRIVYAMARDGLWPSVFARVHPTFRTPYVAVLATWAVMTLLTLRFNNTLELIFGAAFLWLVVYMWAHLLVLVLRRAQPDVPRPYRVPTFVPVVGLLGTGYATYLIYREAWDLAVVGGYIMLGSFVVAALWVRFGPRPPSPSVPSDGGAAVGGRG